MSYSIQFNTQVLGPHQNSILNRAMLEAETDKTPDPHATAAKTAHDLRVGAENITGVSALSSSEPDTEQNALTSAPEATAETHDLT